jgi:hypothetical protein
MFDFQPNEPEAIRQDKLNKAFQWSQVIDFADLPGAEISSSIQAITVSLNGYLTRFVRDADQTEHTVIGDALITAATLTELQVETLLGRIRAPDKTGSYWIIDDDSQEIHLGHWGGIADGAWTTGVAESGTGTDNMPMLQDFVKWRQYWFTDDQDGRRRPVMVGAGVWLAHGKLDVVKPNITLQGKGYNCTVLVGEWFDVFVAPSAQGPKYACKDIKLINNTGNAPGSSCRIFNLRGASPQFERVWFEYDPTGDVPFGYVRDGATSARFYDVVFLGGAAVQVWGNDFLIDGFDYTAALGDDGFAFHVPTGGITLDVAQLYNGTIRQAACFIAMGGSIGTFQADDSTFSSWIRNLQFGNVTVVDCTHIINIKPGAVGDNDRRNGLVDGVIGRNLQIIDREGTKFSTVVMLDAGRGAIIRNVDIEATAFVRAANTSQPNTGLKVYIGDYYYLNYTNGQSEFTAGELVTGATSGATGTVTTALGLITSGSVAGGDAVGFVELSGITGNFVNGENLTVSGVQHAVANGTQNISGGVRPRIYDNKVKLTLRDLYNGDPNGAGKPGYPITYAALFDGSNNTARAGIGKHDISIDVDGTKNSAIVIGGGVVGPINVLDFVGKNLCNTPDNNAYNSPIRHEGAGALNIYGRFETSLSANASATARPVVSDAASPKTVNITAQSDEVILPTIAAGGTIDNQLVFRAKRDCWISRIYLVTNNTIAQSDVDYVTITARNRSTGNPIATSTTKATGGIAVTQFVPIQIGGTDFYTGANSILPKGGTITLNVAPTGAGKAVTSAMCVIEYVEYGDD